MQIFEPVELILAIKQILQFQRNHKNERITFATDNLKATGYN